MIWRPPRDWPEPGPFTGREAVLRQVRQTRETWDADAAEPIGDFIDAADRVVVRFDPARRAAPGDWDAMVMEPTGDFIDVGDRVVVRHVWRTVGRGPRSNLEFTMVYTIHNGKILAIDYFWDHAEALEAAGLSE